MFSLALYTSASCSEAESFELVRGASDYLAAFASELDIVVLSQYDRPELDGSHAETVVLERSQWASWIRRCCVDGGVGPRRPKVCVSLGGGAAEAEEDVQLSVLTFSRRPSSYRHTH